ncbi:MAG: hypothetical protein K6T65_10415 [Peptococcaceae bacterium]|nr:hypothetical protein [Peptococcaceae bacterium]
MFRKLVVLAALASMVVFVAVPAFAEDPASAFAREQTTKAIQNTLHELAGGIPVWTAGVPRLADGKELYYSYHALVEFLGSKHLMPVYADADNHLYLQIRPYIFYGREDGPLATYHTFDWIGGTFNGEIKYGENVYPAEFITVGRTQDMTIAITYPKIDIPEYLKSYVGRLAANSPGLLIVRNNLHIE